VTPASHRSCHTPAAWTRDAVKDIWRRGRFYLGYVVEKRGRDERVGRHEPILSVAEYERTVAAVAARRRLGNKPEPFRHYPLRGLLHCSCGTRMRGEAHIQRGTERRYYRCPTLGCKARRSPADLLEESVLGMISEAVLPEELIETARKELRSRLQTPDVAIVGRQRDRLMTRLDKLKQQHSWGDLTDEDYRRQRDEAKTAPAALPDDNRVAQFDAYRTRVLAFPEAISAASPARLEEVCRIVLERVIVRDHTVDTIEWVPAVRPFFKRQRVCPQGDSNP
jgi:hypothetical protein